MPLAGARLVATMLLTLLPGLALAVLGLRGLADKEAGLRTQYTTTVVLLRDRIAADLSLLEFRLRADVAALTATLNEQSPRALATVAHDRPWMSSPLLLRDDGALVTPRLHGGLSQPQVTDSILPPAAAAALSRAEAAEFAGGLDEALRRYRTCLPLLTSRASRALIRARIGRVLLKLGRLEEAVAVYEMLRAEAAGLFDRNGIPYEVLAGTQLVDAFVSWGRPGEASQERAALLAFVLEHPWDVDNGYGYYLGSAAVAAGPGSLEHHEIQTLQRAIDTIEWGRRALSTAIRSASTDRDDQPFTVRSDATDGHVSLRCVRVAAATLCYALAAEYVTERMLPEVLKRVELEGHISVAVLRDGQPVHAVTGTSATASPLVSADLGVVPGWSIALFDHRGRSIADLVQRERWMYGTLIASMVLMLIGGISLTLRASSREAELVRLKSEFVSNVSHELKTPLALIRMFGETLESGIVTDERKRTEFSAVIRRESERLTHLINNVLDVARIEAGTKDYTFTSVDIARVVRDTAETYRPLFERLGFVLAESLPLEPVRVLADGDAIAQSLVNLFQNSIKYSDHDKHVTLTLTVLEGEVRIIVADRGVGIPAADQSRIFDRYYRVRSGASTGPQGSGLGLAIVKHVAAAHGGRVEVQSAEAKGSVFTLVLPALGVPPTDAATNANDGMLRPTRDTSGVHEAWAETGGDSTMRRAWLRWRRFS